MNRGCVWLHIAQRAVDAIPSKAPKTIAPRPISSLHGRQGENGAPVVVKMGTQKNGSFLSCYKIVGIAPSVRS